MLARRRMSGRELARKLHVSPSWISYRLTGTQPIDLNDLAKIADALEVEPADLLPRPVTRQFPPSRRNIGEQVLATIGGNDHPQRRMVHTADSQPTLRSHKAGRPATPTRPLSRVSL